MEEITGLISNLGFPMALCVYLLVRFEKKIDSLNESINDLNTTLKNNKE